MKVQPTYEDANLILRLYELRREDKLRAARKWLANTPQFTSREQWLQVCRPGTEENAYFRMVTSYWDMAASFVATGVLNSDLFYRANNLELLFVWEKIRIILPEIRGASKNLIQYRHLEEVGKSFLEYMKANAPDWYEQSFAPMIAKVGR